jgi:NitT/TauT family transport system substrate-binding protein
MNEVKLRELGDYVTEWKKLTKANAPPILAVTIVHSDYLAKNPAAVAKFIAALRKANEFGVKNKPAVAEILQKAANMPADDAKAYAAVWDDLYIASFEPADIAALKKQAEIFKAAGSLKVDPLDSGFVTGPYQQSKSIK